MVTLSLPAKAGLRAINYKNFDAITMGTPKQDMQLQVFATEQFPRSIKVSKGSLVDREEKVRGV